ncbi:hypothetical protein E4K10_32300 [Streptomyces sp. T1317-0309]|nr:hypothetical protein E4K10_32300 [Streptomyces sp. T1317-0309]
MRSRKPRQLLTRRSLVRDPDAVTPSTPRPASGRRCDGNPSPVRSRPASLVGAVFAAPGGAQGNRSAPLVIYLYERGELGEGKLCTVPLRTVAAERAPPFPGGRPRWRTS